MKELNRAPRVTRELWHWLRKHCHASNHRGVPEEHKIHGWKKLVQMEFRLHARQVGFEKCESPIAVDLVFAMPRPKAKTRSGKPNHRMVHDVKPDIDNLTKAVFDALNEHAWTDDKLITSTQLVAFVAGDGDRTGCAVRIREANRDVTTWADSMICETNPSLF